MTAIDVRDETGNHAALTEQIHEVITHAAPLVEQVTGLRLPSTVTYRIMDMKSWGQALGGYYGRLARRDTAGMTLTPLEQRKVDSYSSAGATTARVTGTLDDSLTVTDSIGRPQTLIVPEALHHQGVLAVPEALSERVVRALAQQAQLTEATVLPPRIWPLEGAWWSRLASLVFGHANWVGHEVTPHLPGKPTTGLRLPRSTRYRVQSLFAHLLDPGISKRELQAERFIAHVLTHSNLGLFNRVWTDAEWVPTLDEFAQPHTWLRRIDGG
ncbi:zinc-dependent metalloprotease [Streptomyces sp. 110]|uniref:Zinc-dependent metalloprotease n=1 Tax=Streptomyces endocoffeicus TaxID=2898945 RepID=A0ABS1PTQ0_9ACTN|nr:zinc-dependent metalloprotease [Streptomyces endocoffeicus]MBL1115282.1 zinc-dependent metalloprotease [Streptomyces endocoffeicus]